VEKMSITELPKVIFINIFTVNLLLGGETDSVSRNYYRINRKDHRPNHSIYHSSYLSYKDWVAFDLALTNHAQR
jgi:acyl-CoA thioesterase